MFGHANDCYIIASISNVRFEVFSNTESRLAICCNLRLEFRVFPFNFSASNRMKCENFKLSLVVRMKLRFFLAWFQDSSWKLRKEIAFSNGHPFVISEHRKQTSIKGNTVSHLKEIFVFTLFFEANLADHWACKRKTRTERWNCHLETWIIAFSLSFLFFIEALIPFIYDNF